MDYFIERNIVEIKNEYTTFLVNIMTPFLYEGIRSVYQFALNAHKELVEKGKHDPEVKSPGVLKLFQVSLKEIPTLNNNSIEIETNRIKSGSKCSDWFDDLVKAVIKSNIILLTFSNLKKRPEILREQYHNKIEVKDFVHKCYIESARSFYNSPELFWHEFPPLEIKRNQREACELIKQSILEAIRKMLPIKLILKEYLQNDYLEDNEDISNKVSENQYMNIHSMIRRDLHGENDPLGRKPIPMNSVLDPNDNMMGGRNDENEEDYTQEEESSSSEEESSSQQEDYVADGGEINHEDNEHDDSDNEDDDELKLIKEKLQEITKGQEQDKEVTQPIPSTQPTPTQPTQPIPKPTQPTPSQPTQPIVKQSIQNGGSSQKSELDDEIKQLLKKSNVVTSLDKPKTKMSKREALLMKELEEQIKPKQPEPDKKLFFEQYMK